MKIVLTAHDLHLGGTQTYLLTMAEQLQRLGHEVTIHAAEGGPGLEVARSRGLRAAERESELPDSPDVILNQDAMMAYRLAERFPSVPQVFRCPSDFIDLQLPPQIPGVVGALIALSERIAQRLRALALPEQVIRLRQPIDTERFVTREAVRRRPRRALLFGNYLHGARRRLLVETWEANGVECVGAGSMREPELLIGDADIVVAKGKSALEAMACGRAVYVYDAFGSDGWVTPDSYSAMEADNFAGLATDTVASAGQLKRDLAAFRADMGIQNRDLVVRHHSARRHAEALVEVMRGLAPRASLPNAPYHELARMVRLHWQTEARGFAAARENSLLHERLIETERDLAASARAAHERAAAAEQRALDTEAKYRALTSTRRYRLAAAAGRVSDQVRGRA